MSVIEKVIETNSGITKAIILGLAASALIVLFPMAPGLGYVLKGFTKNDKRLKNKRLLKITVKRLERQGNVFWSEKDGKTILKLTESGQKKVLKYKFDDLSLTKPERWDGWIRGVVFDIPEKKKVAREIFRNKLKSIGFYQLQKSVFICPYECKDEIDYLRHTLEISPYVNYFKAKEVGNVSIREIFEFE